MHKGFLFPTSSPTLVGFCILDESHSAWSRWNLSVVLICIFLLAKAEFIGCFLLLHLKSVCSGPLPVYWLHYLLFSYLILFFIYSRYESPVRWIPGKDFSRSVGCLFTLLIVSCAADFLNWKWDWASFHVSQWHHIN
jgi:hypothetical protein